MTTNEETIALFGATGASGSRILTAALAQGYKVRIMVRTPSKVTCESEKLTVIQGDMSNETAIAETLQGADYVISAMGGKLGNPKDFPVGAYLNFTKQLIQTAKTISTVKVLVHQSGAFVPNVDGSQLLMMRIVKWIVSTPLVGIGPNLAENESIQKYIHSVQEEIPFKTIVTRPGTLGDIPSKEGYKLGVTDGSPPNTTSFEDLGVFTINALKDEECHGTMPILGYTKV